MTELAIRVFQNFDADGTPDPEERVEPVRVRGLQAVAGEMAKALAPYGPSLTETPGVYAYQSPEKGAGWLRAEGMGAFSLDRVEELVRLMEIERAIGAKDPIPGVELGMLAPLQIHNRSPFVQILTALGFAGFGVYIGFSSWQGPSNDTGIDVLLLFFTIFLIGMGLFVAIRSAGRVRWWLRARRHALSDGGLVPDDLRFWG